LFREKVLFNSFSTVLFAEAAVLSSTVSCWTCVSLSISFRLPQLGFKNIEMNRKTRKKFRIHSHTHIKAQNCSEPFLF